MPVHVAVLDTSHVDSKSRPHLDAFLSGQISYIKLCDLLDEDICKVDEKLIDFLCRNLRRNYRESVVGH